MSAPLPPRERTRRVYTIKVCPLCGGDRVQLAHGRCADECRGEDGIIPPMLEIRVTPLAEVVEWFEAGSLGDEGEGLLHGLKREFGDHPC